MPIRDLEMHAEGHFQPRFLTVRCFGRQLLTLGNHLILSAQKGLPAIFFLLLGANFGKNLEDFAAEPESRREQVRLVPEASPPRASRKGMIA